MTDPIPHHRAGEPLPSADWNKSADRVTVLTPTSARARVVGAGSGISPVQLIPPHVDITEPPFNCVGDGTTDNTTSMAAAFAAAETEGKPVFIPKGTFLTDTINYRGQSIIGTHMEQCILRGKPSHDVLHLDPAFGQFTRSKGVWKDFTLEVDDTVDASATFTNRGGVGNAGFAVDFNDAAGTQPLNMIDWVFDHVAVKGKSAVNGGQNKSCGWYLQGQTIVQNHIKSATFSYLVYGWRDDYPQVNTGSSSISRDHITVDFLHFLRCANPWRQVNWSFGDVANVMFHGPGTVNAWEMKGVATGGLSAKFFGIHMTGIELAGATGTTIQTDTSCTDLTITNSSFSGNTAITWAGSHCTLEGIALGGTGGSALPMFTITGHRNRIGFIGTSAGTASYDLDTVRDLGVGNQVFVNAYTDSFATIQHRRESLVPDGRPSHLRDSASAALGIVSPMFVGANDLLVNPRTIRPVGVTEGTDFTYPFDAAADFRVALHIVSTGGNFFVNDGEINGRLGSRVGPWLPPGKVRVYIKAKVDTAGTQSWNLEAPSGTSKGSRTLTWTTSYTVQSFEADLTGVAIDTIVQFSAGVIGGGGSGPLDVAWVMFRPWAHDWPVELQAVSADNGDAAKTLVAGTDIEVQRWNTALTAARAVTLSTTNAYNGAKFRIVREATATGAFNLNVGTGPLKSLTAASTWAEVHFDGTAWRLTAAGNL